MNNLCDKRYSGNEWTIQKWRDRRGRVIEDIRIGRAGFRVRNQNPDEKDNEGCKRNLSTYCDSTAFVREFRVESQGSCLSTSPWTRPSPSLHIDYG